MTKTTREAKTRRREFVMVLDVKTEYSNPRLSAEICHVDPESGQLRSILGDRFEEGAEFASFEAVAYLDVNGGTPYGFSADYRSPYRVELYRAELMVKLLRTVDKGMTRLESERGWVAPGDFATYVLRLAEVLGVRGFYTRNTEQAQQVSGEPWRRTDGAGVQSWVQSRTRLTEAATS